MKISSNVKNIIKFGLILLLCVLILFLGFKIIGNIFDKDDHIVSDAKTAHDYLQEHQTVYISGKAYVPKNGIETCLFIGIDSDGVMEESKEYNNAARADMIALVVFDNSNKEFSVIQINRDTITNVDEYSVTGDKLGAKKMQIGYAYTYGDGLKESCKHTVSAVSNFLYSVNIDKYISMTMSGVAIITDEIGGVNITLEEDLTEINSEYLKGANITLKGQQALAFVRARMGVSDGTNISRMNRQKQFLSALFEKYSNSEVDVAKIFESASEYLITDSSAEKLSEYSKKFCSYNYIGTSTVSGDTQVVNGYMEFYPNEEELKAMVVDKFYSPVEE